MAWEGRGGRREDALRWHECIKLQARLEIQSRVWPRKQPLVSRGFFMSLVGLLCPLRHIKSPWKPQELEGGETDGHPVPPLPVATSPLGGSAKVPEKVCFLPNTRRPPPGIAEPPAQKQGRRDRPGDRQTDSMLGVVQTKQQCPEQLPHMYLGKTSPGCG